MPFFFCEKANSARYKLQTVKISEKNMNKQRFYDAHAIYYRTALAEMKRGRKESCWIWFVFPELYREKSSDTSKRYAIHDANEAYEFLSDPLLGGHLREISEAVLALDSSPMYFMRLPVDVCKLQRSMTLFDYVGRGEPQNAVFGKILDKFYGGKRDKGTLDKLQAPKA